MSVVDDSHMGISGRLAAKFQNNALTPLLALMGLLLGFFAIAITPKEEEPQIDVTFANVFIPFPGATAKEVESLVSIPAEQVLSELAGVDDIYSVSSPGMSVVTVAFKVGLPRQEAIVKLYNQVMSHQNWLPRNIGAGQPLIVPKGIDDVPIMSLTIWSEDAEVTTTDLSRMAETIEPLLKRVEGTRDIYTQGEQSEAVVVEVNPISANAYGVNWQQIRGAIASGNFTGQPTNLYQQNGLVKVQVGDLFKSADELANLVVGLNNGKPVYLADVAKVTYQAQSPKHLVMHQQDATTTRKAVTVAVAKKPGVNAIEVTENISKLLTDLKGSVIPDNIVVSITRDYGQTAKTKSNKLIGKLLFATFAVIVLVLATMGWREAIIVGGAIFITLAITLFASWAWGFTLNRVSLFALIFSIGILVDDAIVVVENIHRHIHLGAKNLLEAIPRAVEEVGGPTILATFTVIAALMPMAFVTGLMGPYMSPIPINASTGMLISLIVAFIVTPWLSFKLLKLNTGHESHSEEDNERELKASKLYKSFNKIMRPMMEGENNRWQRNKLGLIVAGLIVVAMALPVFNWVVLKMLPFDNKSEFQVVVDMKEGTPVETTMELLQKLSDEIHKEPEVDSTQLYAGTHSPINFNGLVRQYFMRSEPHMADIQVNLIDKSMRDRQSHEVARGMRESLQEIGKPYDANVKVVEVPPGPPVMAPIVAEIYGQNYEQQLVIANQVRKVFEETADIVDVDDSQEFKQEQWRVHIDRQRAAVLGVDYGQLVDTVTAILKGESPSYLHDSERMRSTPIKMKVATGVKTNVQQLLSFKVPSKTGGAVPLVELVSISKGKLEKSIYHKNLRPVVFVTADMAGELDSPLYGLFEIAASMENSDFSIMSKSASSENPIPLTQFYIDQPMISVMPEVKWDGEWQITYETFRDMGIAYAVGMVLIYLLVVAQFKSYLVPLIIMAPIPLTIIGVMPGHALIGAQFTATSMIGMIALAGIIVRNSILLVDFINESIAQGMELVEAVVQAAAIRSKPIALTGVAAMIGALFILDDPIFSGLAVSLVFGIFVSTLLTLVVIPILYFSYLSYYGFDSFKKN